MTSKNVLVFSIDDMRAVNDWGHFTPLIVTPGIDRLAEMGTTFERAITQVPLCNPSRTSVLSGLQPTQTGVLDNDTPWFERVDPAQTLPGVLKAAGAYVAMYGKNFHGQAISATDRAIMFDDYMEAGSDGSIAQVINDEVRHDTPYKSGRYGGSIANLGDERAAAAAIDFLQGTAADLDQPFFLSVGISKPHLNWWVPSAFYDLYDPAEIRATLELSLADGTLIPGADEYLDVPPMSKPTSTHGKISADMDLWVDYIHAYLAAVSYADSKVGAVLDALEADPELAADTAILLWSDHGYHLGDRDRWGKFSHWRESTEVPFILVDPDTPGGQTSEQIVSLVDIFPTVLDWMKVEPPTGVELAGNSLTPILKDIDIDWYDPGAGKGVAVTMVQGTVSIRAEAPGMGDMRYTRYPDGTEELYDISADPEEHVNRLHVGSGAGLTPVDDARHELMSALMDGQLARVGLLVSDGVHRTVGGDGDEMLVTTNNPGVNVLAGGDGDDVYYLYRNATIVEAAGGGHDMVVLKSQSLEAGFHLPANVEALKAVRDATGNGLDNELFGGEESGKLIGLGGDDRIFGGGGDDVMVGGPGQDRLTGGAGRDIFDFNYTGESGSATYDTITRFEGPGAANGDRIDLSDIDANFDVKGNQKFIFGGTTAGHVWAVDKGGNTEILANTDADGKPELRIVIEDGATKAAAYTADDIIL